LFFSIFLVLLFLLLTGFLIFTNWKINRQRAGLSERITTLKQEVAALEEKNQELKKKMSEANSEEFLEEVARNDLGLQKPGEEVVVVQKESSSGQSPEQKEPEKSGWQKIWQKIKAVFGK